MARHSTLNGAFRYRLVLSAFNTTIMVDGNCQKSYNGLENTNHFVTKTDKFHRIQHKNILQTVQIHAELYQSERTVNRPYHRISVCIKRITTMRMVDYLLPRVYTSRRPTYAQLFSVVLHKTILIVTIIYK